MKMTKDKFNETVHKFVWESLIPDASSLAEKGLLGGIERLGLLRIGPKNEAMLRTLGILDAEGAVDVDLMKEGAYGAAEAAGGAIVVGDRPSIRLPRPALDKFFRFLETGTVE